MRVLIIMVVAAAFLVPVAASAAPLDQFTGAWVATDTDGSTLRLEISAADVAGVRHVTLFDSYATGCGGGSATGIGSGSVSGDTLEADILVRCNRTHTSFSGSTSIVAVDGTLFSGVVYVRQGGA
jgi:hypothetical protein